MTGRCTRWQRWLPGSGGGLKVLNWNLHLFQLLEIIQVLDSISWVRCASGNVFDYYVVSRVSLLLPGEVMAPSVTAQHLIKEHNLI